MKLKRTLFLILSFVVLTGCTPNPKEIKQSVFKKNNFHAWDLTCNGIYGPYTRDSGTIKLDFKYYSDTDWTAEVVKVKEKNAPYYFYSHNAYYHDHDYDYERTTFTIYLPLDEILTDKGIEVFIFINDYFNGENLLSTSFLLHPKTKHYINTAEQKEYIASGCMFNIPYTPDSDYLRERFYFDNIPATFSNSDYFTLPLDDFYFYYHHLGHSFIYQEAYLTCDDPFNVFPYLKTNGKVKIPLKLTASGNSVYISYKGTMFVNTVDLTMSLVGRVGFTSTNTFYMPRGKNNELDDTRFYIVIVGAGIHDTDISIPVTYYSLSNRFGNCDDSEYCIRGGVYK